MSCAMNVETRSRGKIISILPPKDGKHRARKVVTRSRGRPTGKYPSWKMGRMIQWESVNELNAYRLLDANPLVAGYYEQPFIIHYQLNGKTQLHYPDTLVLIGSAKELWEIKPTSEAAKSEVIERTALLTSELPNHGFSYRLVVAEELRSEPRLANVLTILKFGRNPISTVAREHLRLVLMQEGRITWGAVASGAMGPTGRHAVCRLVLEGVLTFEMDRSWTNDTVLRWASNNAFASGDN
jgi:hypothetical protein